DRIGGVKRAGRIDKEPSAGKFAVLIGRLDFDDSLGTVFETSLTSRLMVVAESGPGCAESEAATAKNASFASKRNPSTELELESRLITHRHAVEHVARCAAPVSLG